MPIDVQTHMNNIFLFTSTNKNIEPEVLKVFNSLWLFLQDHCWISSAVADKAGIQYNALIKNAYVLAKGEKSNIKEGRIGIHFMLVFLILVILLSWRTL